MNTRLNNDKNELNEQLNGFSMTETEHNAKNNQLIKNEKLMKNKLDELESKYNKWKQTKMISHRNRI